MADVQITITIPDAHVATCVESFNTLAGKELAVAYSRGETSPDVGDKMDFLIEEKGSGETNMDFGKRFIIELVKNAVRLGVFTKNLNAYKASMRDAIKDVAQTSKEVDENIIN
jgi:hypothetical protein